jgi:uncharacterized protein (DUF488 family)
LARPRRSCPTSEAPSIFTIGHSTRSIEEFAAILEDAGVKLCVDVRTIPRSGRNPQFNGDSLPQALSPWQIGYKRIGTLGGLRSRSGCVAPELNAFWKNQSFHNYADYALSAEFALGLGELIAASGAQRSAIICAEAVWWRCHRRIIADYLLERGLSVTHLMGIDRSQAAFVTPAALERDGLLVYPAPAKSEN